MDSLEILLGTITILLILLLCYFYFYNSELSSYDNFDMAVIADALQSYDNFDMAVTANAIQSYNNNTGNNIQLIVQNIQYLINIFDGVMSKLALNNLALNNLVLNFISAFDTLNSDVGAYLVSYYNTTPVVPPIKFSLTPSNIGITNTDGTNGLYAFMMATQPKYNYPGIIQQYQAFIIAYLEMISFMSPSAIGVNTLGFDVKYIDATSPAATPTTVGNAIIKSVVSAYPSYASAPTQTIINEFATQASNVCFNFITALFNSSGTCYNLPNSILVTINDMFNSSSYDAMYKSLTGSNAMSVFANNINALQVALNNIQDAISPLQALIGNASCNNNWKSGPEYQTAFMSLSNALQ